MLWWAKRRRANRLSAQNSAYFCLAERLWICRFDVFLFWIRFEFYACVWVFFRMLLLVLHSLRVPRLITRILHSFFSFFFYWTLYFVFSFILCFNKHSFINGFFALTNTPWFTEFFNNPSLLLYSFFSFSFPITGITLHASPSTIYPLLLPLSSTQHPLSSSTHPVAPSCAARRPSKTGPTSLQSDSTTS